MMTIQVALVACVDNNLTNLIMVVTEEAVVVAVEATIVVMMATVTLPEGEEVVDGIAKVDLTTTVTMATITPILTSKSQTPTAVVADMAEVSVVATRVVTTTTVTETTTEVATPTTTNNSPMNSKSLPLLCL